MNIVVINGTEKRGVTYRLKELFLAEFKAGADITEYFAHTSATVVSAAF